MTEQIAKSITYFAIQNQILNERDVEIGIYSFQLLIETVCILGSIFLIGFTYHLMLPTLIYIIFFVPLRIFSGGWHARNFTLCYLITVGFYVLPVVLSYTANMSSMANCVCLILASIVVLMLSPISDPNKPATANDLARYKKYTRRILFLEIILILIFFATGVNSKVLCFAVYAIVHQSILLICSCLFRTISSKVKEATQ